MPHASVARVSRSSVALQKTEMEKAKTKKANADKGNEKKTMKDKVLEKEFKLVRSACAWDRLTWCSRPDRSWSAPVSGCSSRAVFQLSKQTGSRVTKWWPLGGMGSPVRGCCQR